MKRKAKTTLISVGFFFAFLCFVQAENAVTNLNVASYTQGSGSLYLMFFYNCIVTDSLKGKVKVNNIEYEVICDCAGKLQVFNK